MACSFPASPSASLGLSLSGFCVQAKALRSADLLRAVPFLLRSLRSQEETESPAFPEERDAAQASATAAMLFACAQTPNGAAAASLFALLLAELRGHVEALQPRALVCSLWCLYTAGSAPGGPAFDPGGEGGFSREAGGEASPLREDSVVSSVLEVSLLRRAQTLMARLDAEALFVLTTSLSRAACTGEPLRQAVLADALRKLCGRLRDLAPDQVAQVRAGLALGAQTKLTTTTNSQPTRGGTALCARSGLGASESASRVCFKVGRRCGLRRSGLWVRHSQRSARRGGL